MPFRTAIYLLLAFGFIGTGPRGKATADDRPSFTLSGWGHVFGPDHDCLFGPGVGKIRVLVPRTAHDFAAELGRWNAPRLMTTRKGNFLLQVKVSGTFKAGDRGTIEGRKPYNGAGLILVADSKNYVSLHRSAVFLGDKVRHYANFELRKDGKQAITRFDRDLEDKDCYLRLDRRGSKVTASFSQNGVTWNSYEPLELDYPETLETGIVAVNSANIELFCTFSELMVIEDK